MYRLRWRLLLFLVFVFGIVPLAAGLVAGANLLPLAICWGLVFLVGAGGAGLRARGSAYQAPEQDWDQHRAADPQFERPRDEGRLL
jgi:hypothetical protein